MILNARDRSLELFDFTHELRKPVNNNEPCTVEIISMISKDTTSIEFDKFRGKFPNYKLEMTGPIGSLRCTSLAKAILENNFSLSIHLIKETGIKNINMLCSQDSTPLDLAFTNRFFSFYISKNQDKEFELINYLVISGADVNLSGTLRKGDFYNYPLSNALKYSDIKVVKLLLNFGAKKQYIYTPDKKALVKQEFEKQEDAIYKSVKKEIKTSRYQFISGLQDPGSMISWIPKDIVGLIIKCDYEITQTPYSERIRQAKKQIASSL